MWINISIAKYEYIYIYIYIIVKEYLYRVTVFQHSRSRYIYTSVHGITICIYRHSSRNSLHLQVRPGTHCLLASRRESRRSGPLTTSTNVRGECSGRYRNSNRDCLFAWRRRSKFASRLISSIVLPSASHCWKQVIDSPINFESRPSSDDAR